MSKPNLNTPAIYTDTKLDATDFENIQGDESDGLPMPTRRGQRLAVAAIVASAVLAVFGIGKLAMVVSNLIAQVLP